jgi:hypothetical protein
MRKFHRALAAMVIFYAAPEWIFTLIYTVFTALVILTWLAYPPQRKLK